MLRHIATSIDGLMKLSDRELQSIAKCCYEDGRQLKTAAQVREMLQRAKESGMQVIPSLECDNYDERGYCRGHEKD